MKLRESWLLILKVILLIRPLQQRHQNITSLQKDKTALQIKRHFSYNAYKIHMYGRLAEERETEEG